MLTFSQQVAISNPACVKLESDPFPSLPTVAFRRLYRELQDSCRGAMDKLTTASMSSIKVCKHFCVCMERNLLLGQLVSD